MYNYCIKYICVSPKGVIMSMYDDVNKLYCKSSLYDAEFLNYEDDFVFWKYWINKIKPKSVIEIGIGNGRLVNLLSPLVDKYDGIEISTNIIKDFKIKNPKYK